MLHHFIRPRHFYTSLLLCGLLSACVHAPASQSPSAAGPARSVAAFLETPAVNADGDAADDPAIWVAPDRDQSVIIGTQKKGALYLYSLSGEVLQQFPAGRPNNVDIRNGFPWPDKRAPLVATSNRADNSITFYRFDDVARRVIEQPVGKIATGFEEVYGLCLGRMGKDFVALATDKDGDVGVWRVSASQTGEIQSERLVAYALGSIAEGCVIDDRTGRYFVGQEEKGIWAALLSDRDGSKRVLIDEVGKGRLVADVEGLAIWHGHGQSGYLVASVQGSSSFAAYDRRPPHAHLFSFVIAGSADGRTDGVSGTDGIEVISNLRTKAFPKGLMVVQDDENTAPDEAQNFKLISWADIVRP